MEKAHQVDLYCKGRRDRDGEDTLITRTETTYELSDTDGNYLASFPAE